MELDTIMQAVGSLGFPIAAFFLMWKTLGDEQQSHKDEVRGMTEAVNNNTQALLRLAERMNREERKNLDD